jgi:hypothetical protein
MKLRLKPNSVRLRLNQTEVTKFVNVGELAERIEFPGPVPIVLLYGLRVSSDLLSGTARFENGELTVTIPENHAKAWASRAEEIGLYYEPECDGGKPLRVMIEKDFQCIDGPPDEIDPAGYPNPLAMIGCKSNAE